MTHDDEAFFNRLIDLLELEQAEQRARLDELRKTLSPLERAERGIALLDVEAVDDSFGLGGRVLIDLERADRAALGARVGVGDLVELRPRRSEVGASGPDDPRDASARGVVARRTRTRVTVAFDQPPPPFVLAGRLIVDLTPNDVTFARARRAVEQVRDAERGAVKRHREVLLGREPARFAPPPPVPATALNPEQRTALARALSADDFFLVHGPPGTGKSTVLIELVAQAVARGERVLATAPSNAAVDHLLDLCIQRGLPAVRVGHPARVAERLYAHTLDAQVEAQADRVAARELFDEAYALQGYARRQRSRGRSAARFANAREAAGEARRLFAEARALERRAVAYVMGRAKVVCATCAALPGSDLEGEAFDLAVLDEATQAVEPVALLAFLKAPRVVLAGDHRQLPPTVISREAAARGLGTSLFERLLATHGDAVRVMLREQYRMNEPIMAFPSAQMYDGALRAHPSVARRVLGDVLASSEDGGGGGSALDAPPVLFLDTAGKGFDDEQPPDTDSYRNPGEAALVVARLEALLRAGLAPGEVALIAPYSAQVALLRELVAARGLSSEVEVDTVDAFQGREKDAVLVTLTRANADGEVGFLADLRRMNVAITRARRHLFVVGDAATLARHEFYRAFVEHAQALGGYRTAWDWAEGE